MALTEDEIAICNQALDRIAVGQISVDSQSDVKGIACNLHYPKAREALIRKYDFSFAVGRTRLEKIKTITLNIAPDNSNWSIGDIIFGLNSGCTATILTVTSGIVYDIINLTGEFTSGETITNGQVVAVEWNGIPLEFGDEAVYWLDNAGTKQVVCGSGYPMLADSKPLFEWDYQYQLPDDYVTLLEIYENDGYDLPWNRFAKEGKKILTNYNNVHIKYVKNITDPKLFEPLFEQMLVLALAIRLIPPLCGTSSELMRELKQEYNALSVEAKAIDEQEQNTTGYSNWNLARF